MNARQVGKRPLLAGVAMALLLGASFSAHADWTIGAGAATTAGGGAIDLACTDLFVTGTLTVGAGGRIHGVRNVTVAPGGQINLGGGRIELTQQWNSAGTVTAGGGQVLRVQGTPDCPAVGAIGPISISGTPQPPIAAPVPVPVTDGPVLALLAAMLAFFGLRQRRMRRGT